MIQCHLAGEEDIDMGNLVIREDQEGIATLTLNRPEALNALSPALFAELRSQVAELDKATDSVGCVILAGNGRSFSAGNDLKAIAAGARPSSPHFQAETLEAIERLPQPVIAAVQGHCYTGALELVLACDLMLTTPSARFADTHGKWGLTPTWGMSQRLPRRIGLLKAREIMFTGRVVSGEEAAAIGLANLCVPQEQLMEKTLEMARQITENSWHTLRADKMLLQAGAQRHLDEGLEFERSNSPGAGPDAEARIARFGR